MTEIFITGADLVAEPSKGMEWLCSGLVAKGTLGMIHAATGVGKTHFSMWLAICLATGSSFFRFACPKPSHVVLVDGEMGKESLKRRLRMFAAGLEKEEPTNDYLRIITPDLCAGAVPNMADAVDRKRYDRVIPEADVIIFDNLLSCSWATNPIEREETTWKSIQRWIVELRSKGKAVIIVHHSNKAKSGQLGSSTKEHVMDWIIQLKRPVDYRMEQGAKFWMSFDKARHLFGEDPKPLSVQLLSTESVARWEWSPLQTEIETSVYEMDRVEMRPQDIALALGISLYEVKSILAAQAPKIGGGDGSKEIPF